MIIVMHKAATQSQVNHVVARVQQMGCQAFCSQGIEATVIGINNHQHQLNQTVIENLPGVARLMPVSKPYKLASRDFHPADTLISIGDLTIGGNQLTVIGGPCAVEDREQILTTAHAVKAAGAHILRGGAYKPRSSPYAFQGLGEAGLELLALAREETGLPIITEVLDPETVPLVRAYADILQIGARNMQNYSLLHAVGESQHPVLLKRSMMATVEEFLMAAEYILSHGNHQVILCERGIRTYETATRNTFDINAIPVLKEHTHLPVFADPSHATGKRSLVAAIAKAAVAAGADGLAIEVHPQPDAALADGAQSLTPPQFSDLMQQVRRLAVVMQKEIMAPSDSCEPGTF